MKRSTIWLLALALVAAFLPGARAQEEDLAALYGDEEFVSIATGSKKPITKAPAVASVITAEDIKAMGATTLDQVLETVPGLHVSLSTLSRLDAVYSIRGIHTGFNPQVLMLMNGIPFQSVWSGGRPSLFHLPISNIARIEIIRGPGSAVFGADAYSGVINIITKDTSDIGGTIVGGREGSFNSHDIWLQHGNTYADWDLAFSFEWQTTDGDPDRIIKRDLQTSLDEAFGTSASLAPGHLRTNYNIFNTHLELRRILNFGDFKFNFWNWKLEEAGQGAGGAQALDRNGKQKDNLYLLDLNYHTDTLANALDLNIGLNYQYLKDTAQFTLLPPGAVVPIGSDGNINFITPAGIVLFPQGVIGNPGGVGEDIGLDWAALYDGIVNHRFRVGSGFKYRKFNVKERKNYGPGVIDGTQPIVYGNLTDVSDTPFAFAQEKTREVWYLSIQDEWQVAPDWELTAGLRYDDYSDFGHTINPRLALVWATRHNLTTKLLYGTAFRAPSFSELYAINNPIAQGNNNLDPETINTLELAFDYKPTFDLQLGLSLFAYEAKDLIEFVADQNGTSRTAQNARDQVGHGLELEVDWTAIETLHIRGNYAWQHSEDKKTNDRIPDAPGQQAYLKADWKFLPEWFLAPQVTWVGDRVRASDETRPDIDDYTLVDLTLRKDNVLKGVDVAISSHNIFDEKAFEPSDGTIPGDYPLAGRSFWFEMSWRM